MLESMKMTNMSDILKENKIPVNLDFVIKITKDNFESIDHETKKKCKVIKFSQEWSYDDVLLTISRLDTEYYPNAFIIIIDTTQTEDQASINILKKFLVNFAEKRSIILQFTSKNRTKFYYKEDDSKEFQDVEEQHVNKSDDFNGFSSFLWLYLKNTINMESLSKEKFNNIQNSSLILKFLRVLKLDEDLEDLLVLKCTAEGSISDLLAIANGYMENGGEICGYELQWYLSCEFKSTSVLMTAVQHSNQTIIEFLIKNCANLIQFLPKEHQIAISTLLYNTNRIDVLCDLLEQADFPFPEIRNPTSINNLKFQEIIDNRAKFHENIRAKNISEIQKFEKKHTSLKFAYNLENKSALAQSLESKAFKSFFYLKSLRFNDHQIGGIKNSLNDKEKEKMNQEASKQRKENVEISSFNKHNSVLQLATKSSIYNRNESKEIKNVQYKKIKEWLKDIYKTKYGCKLLDAAAQCNELRMVFDFECDSTENVDPSSNSSSKGATYPVSKWIFIGAMLTGDKEREQKIKGVIAHEICHYVMRLIYQNNDNPYYGDDEEAKQQFEEIASAIKSMLFPQKVQEQVEEEDFLSDNVKINEEKNSDNELEESEANYDECEGIISTVYTLYEQKDWHPELIVRPVHIQAQFDNNQEVLTKLEQKYENIYKFVDNQIVPELEKFNLKQRENVDYLNKIFGTVTKLKSSKLELSETRDLSFVINHQLVIVFSNSSYLFLINIFKYLSKTSLNLLSIRNIFMATRSLKNDYIRDKFKEILNQSQTYNIIVDCTKAFETITELISSKKRFILVVSTEDQRKKLKENLINLKIIPTEVTVNYSWNDLSSESKSFLLNTKVNFQNNSSFSLFELINSDVSCLSEISANDECFDHIIDNQMLNLLVEKSEISINNCSLVNNSFKLMFQPRSLIKIVIKEGNEVSIVENMSLINEEQNRIFSKALFNFSNFVSNVFFNNPSKDISSKQTQQIENTEDDTNRVEIDQLIEDLTNDKYVLISDKAGTGKSWILKYTANKLKMKHSKKWVSYVDLKQFIPEFIQQFKDQDSKLEFVAFLVGKIIKPKTKFELEIFKKLYQNGKVCILFDGFDEIAPDCAEFVTKLCQSFQKNGGNQLWIATRDYFEIDLKEKLELEDAYKLDKFTEENGVELIISCWVYNEMQYKIENCKGDDSITESEYFENISKYKNKAQSLVKKIPKSQSNKIGLPQFYEMIASITQNKKDTVIDFTTFKLFEECVKIQYERWSKAKGKLRSNANTASLEKELNYQTLHQLIAIMGLFPGESQYCDLNIQSLKQWSIEEIIAFGQLIKRGEIYFFNHETFRELNAAKFILRTLSKHAIHKNMWKYLLQFLTIKKYGIIRLFTNDALKEKENLKEVMPNLPKIAKSLESYNLDHTILLNCLEERLENLAELIIKIINHLDKKIIKNVLMMNKSILYLVANYGNLFIHVQNFVFEHSTKNDMENLLMKDATFLLIITSIPDKKNTEEFLKIVELKISKEFIRKALKSNDKNGENILFYLLRSNNVNMVKLKNIFEILKRCLTSNEIIDLARNSKNCYGLNLLQMIFGTMYIEKIKFTWTQLDEIYKSINNSGNLLKLIMKYDQENRQNFLHILARSTKNELHEALWELLPKTFDNRDELKDCIMQKDKYGDSFVHCLVIYNEPEIIDFTITKIREILSADQFEGVLKSKGNYERNLFQIAACESKDIKTHQILWKIFRAICNSDREFLMLLTEVDNHGNNIFHLAVNFTTKDIFEFMINELEKITSNEEIRNILRALGFENRNLLQSAAVHNESIKLHKYLWSTVIKYFKSQEIFGMIKHSDEYGYNLLLNAIEFNKKEILELTWTKIKNAANKTSIQGYLSAVNNQQENILHILIKSKDLKKIKFLVAKLTKNLTSQQMGELINQMAAEYKQNLLHYAVNFDKIEFYVFFWEFLLNTFENREELKDLIMKVDKYGNNFVHSLVNFSKSEIIEFTITKIKENFSAVQFEEILKSKSQVGRNVLQIAAYESKNIKKYQILCKIYQDFYNSNEEFPEFLSGVSIRVPRKRSSHLQIIIQPRLT